MVELNIPEDIMPKPFFEELVPQQFKAVIAEQPIEGIEGIEFSLQFDINGPNGGSWGVVVTDGKNMEIKPGGYENALLTVKLTEKDWRDAITGKAGLSVGADMGKSLSGEQARSQFEILKNIRGKLEVELIKDDGSIFPVTIVFNKSDSPVAKIKMKMTDYLEMQAGKLDGPGAFMQGKLQLEGDMMFAMQLGQLRL